VTYLVSENKTAATSVLFLKFRNHHWPSYTQFQKVSSSSASSSGTNTGPDAQTQKEIGLKGTALSSVMTHEASDIKAARTFPCEKEREHSRDTQY